MSDEHTGGGGPRSWLVRHGAAIGLGVALAAVFWPVLRHPTELLYSPRSDLLAFVHPYRVLQNQAVAAFGGPTFFDPTSFGGIPVVGDAQSGFFYPLNWIHLLDASGEGEAFYGWLTLLHFAIGGLGVLAWLGGRGFSSLARLAGALAFVFSGKFFFHVLTQGHAVFLPFMWVPWQLMLVDRLFEKAESRTVALLAGATALGFVGSHPQSVLYSQCFVLAYALLGRERRLREISAWPFVAAGASVVLAALLSAAHWMPVVAGLEYQGRGEGLSYAEAGMQALGAGDLLSFVWPTEIPRRPEPIPYAGFGVLPALVLAALLPGRRRLFALALGTLLVMGLYAMGEAAYLHRLLFEVVPGFDLFRLPARIFLVAGLPLALVLAIAVERVMAWAPRTPWVGAAALILVAVDQTFAAFPQVETRPIDAALGHNPVVARVSRPWGEGRFLGMNPRATGDMSVLPATYATRAGVESVRGFNPVMPRAVFDLLVRGVGARPDAPMRGVTVPSFALERAELLDLLNVRSIAANHPLDRPGWRLRQAFGPIDVYLFQTPSPFTTLKKTFLYENTRAMPRAALVREAVLRSEAPLFDQLAQQDPRSAVIVDEPSLVGRYPGDFEELDVRHAGDRIGIDVDAGAGGYLVLSEFHHDGWGARSQVGEEPIHRGNGFFQVIRLGPGRHELEIRFAPPGLAAGAKLTALGLALAGFALVWSRPLGPQGSSRR